MAKIFLLFDTGYEHNILLGLSYDKAKLEELALKVTKESEEYEVRLKEWNVKKDQYCEEHNLDFEDWYTMEFPKELGDWPEPPEHHLSFDSELIIEEREII